MTISYEILESFDGTRTSTMPSTDEEGGTEEVVNENVRDIQVKFKDGDSTLTERMVNVVFDEEGDYDDAATITRIEEVMLGVEHKAALGMYL